MLWGWMRTSRRAGSRSKSQRASMSSSPLFISVAESTVTLRPIFQRGWRRASSGVLSAISEAGVRKNGPPEAVRMTRLTKRRFSRARHWKTPLCSLSTGMIRAPERRGLLLQEGAGDDQGLLVGQGDLRPGPDGGQGRPEAVDAGDGGDDDVVPRTAGDLGRALRPETTRTFLLPNRRRNSAASRSVLRETISGPKASACSRRRRTLEPAARPTTLKRSRRRAATSSVLRPIDPVEPRTAIFSRRSSMFPEPYFQRTPTR